MKFDSATEAEISARIMPSEHSQWYAFEGRVLAIASAEVHDAFKAARDAHQDVLAAIGEKNDGGEENRAYLEVNPGSPPPFEVGASSHKIRKLRAEADVADDRVTKMVRIELLMESAATRRRLRLSHRKDRTISSAR
jgi:hypothetical protein